MLTIELIRKRIEQMKLNKPLSEEDLILLYCEAYQDGIEAKELEAV